MLNLENKNRCRKTLDKFGYRPQLLILIEECSELQKEACKMLRNGTSATPAPENFKEELVDVMVMVTQAAMMCGITDAEINARAQKKLDRALEREWPAW